MGSKVRVLPNVPPSGLWVLCLAAGALHGVIGAWLVYWLRDAITPSGASASVIGLLRWFLIVLAAFCVPAWVAGQIVGRVHPRIGRIILLALCYGAACVGAVLLVGARLNPESLLSPWLIGSGDTTAVGIVMTVLVYGAVLTAVIASVMLAGVLFERMFGRRVVTQSGLLCWQCGYNLGAVSLTTCPECGSEFHPGRFPGNNSLDLLRTLTRGRWAAAVLAFLLCATPLVFTVVNHTIPCSRFLNAHPARAELRQVWNMQRFSTNGLATGWWIPDPDAQDVGIAVQFTPASEKSVRGVMVSRGCLVDPAAGAGFPSPRTGWWVLPGSMAITAHLSQEQVEHVLQQHEVPASLLDALHAEAAKVGWTTAGIGAAAGAERQVDPTPHFPQTATPASNTGK